MTSTTLTWESFHEIEQFLFREAQLADAHAYDEWLALWTKELVYWVPIDQARPDPASAISLIYDDRERLEERLFRLGTNLAHAQRPRS